ncbi:unnamed protein product [Orchesella dallaii]|uniref:Odorant receptor n=1 Tax=Orchesella dallaii TaxID=48710 RepID=A0ABP1PR37_9HEXA
MYSSFSFKLIKSVFTIVSLMGFSPITWNEKKQIFDCHSLITQLRVCFNLVGVYVYTICLIPYNLIQTRKTKDFQQFNYTFVVWLCSLIGNLMVSTQFFRCDQICQILNGYFLYLRKFEAQYVRQHKRERNAMDHFINTMSVWIVVLIPGAGLLIITHYFVFPRSAPYMTYLIPDIYFFTCIYIGQGLVLMFSTVGLSLLLAGLMLMMINFFAYAGVIYKRELKLGLDSSKYIANPQLRQVSHLTRNWRALELIIIYGCNILGFTIIPLQTILSQLSLFCNVTFVLFGDHLELKSKFALPFLSINCIIGWCIFLSLAGKLFTSTKATLGSWKFSQWPDKKTRMFMKRYKKSCQPYSIHVGKYMVVRPKSVLNFLRASSRGTFRALVALRKALAIQKH